jgi:hypothetical protein
MVDVCLGWTQVGDEFVEGITPDDVLRIARAHGLRAPERTPGGSVASFRSAARSIVREYVDDFGRPWRMVGEIASSAKNLTATAAVSRVPAAGLKGPETAPFKVAEARCMVRPEGPVIQTNVRKSLGLQDREQARAWLDELSQRWRVGSRDDPPKLMRRIIIDIWRKDVAAWPANDFRSGVYFLHAERRHFVDRLAEVLAEVSLTAEVACFPIVAGPRELALIIERLDAALAEEVRALAEAVEARISRPQRWRSGGPGQPPVNKFPWFGARLAKLEDAATFHEKRLCQELRTTRHWCGLVRARLQTVVAE